MKKFLALVAVVCLVLMSTAFAQSFPSKTAQDMTIVTYDFTGWSIFVVEPTEQIQDEVKLMGEHVADGPIATFFDPDVQEKILEFKPEAVADVNDLIAYELVAVACDGYVEEYGDAYAYFEFATTYPENAEVTVLVGLPKEQVEENTDMLAWSVQKCVVENGKITVQFVKDELLKMEEIPALMVVLSAEIA